MLKSDDDCDLLDALRAVRDDRPYFTSRIAEMVDEHKNTLKCNPEAPRELDGEISLERLTMIEQKVLALLYEGMSSKETASRLALTSGTIKLHRGHIMKKLQMTAFSGLMRYAIRHGMVPA